MELFCIEEFWEVSPVFPTVFLGRFFYSEENETYCPQSQARRLSSVQVISENTWTCLQLVFASTDWKYGFYEQLILPEKMMRGGPEIIPAGTPGSGLWFSQAVPPVAFHTKAYIRAFQTILYIQALWGSPWFWTSLGWNTWLLSSAVLVTCLAQSQPSKSRVLRTPYIV